MRANTVNRVPEAPSDQDPGSVASPRPAAGRVFEGARPVRLGDVRPSGRLRLDAAVRYLQDVSADDTADAHLPDAQGWVVRRTRLEVRRFPRYLERLRLATWCSGTGSHYAGRRVEVRGDQGAELDADALWVHVDLATGRPQRLAPAFFERYGEAAGGRSVKARLHHGAPPVEAPREVWPLRATDLDLLGHVNNAAYWEVVEEALARHGGATGPIRAELEHHRAAEPGHAVEWVERADEAGRLSVWVLADGAVAASARVEPLGS
jgi:acyl-ACP thioesterase